MHPNHSQYPNAETIVDPLGQPGTLSERIDSSNAQCKHSAENT